MVPVASMPAPIPIIAQVSSDKPPDHGVDGASPLKMVADPTNHLKVSPPQTNSPLLTFQSCELTRWGSDYRQDRGYWDSRDARLDPRSSSLDIQPRLLDNWRTTLLA